MVVYLLGYKPLDFTNNRGELVKGTQVFVAFQEDGVVGRQVDKLFFKDGMELPKLNPGMTLNVTYNRKGKPVSCTVESTPQRLNIDKK